MVRQKTIAAKIIFLLALVMPTACAGQQAARSSGSPISGRWQLVLMDDRLVVNADETVFIDDTTITFMVDCNWHTSDLQIGRDEFRTKIGRIRTTAIACNPNASYPPERQAIASAAVHSRYRLSGDRLTILPVGGWDAKALEFRSVK